MPPSPRQPDVHPPLRLHPLFLLVPTQEVCRELPRFRERRSVIPIHRWNPFGEPRAEDLLTFFVLEPSMIAAWCLTRARCSSSRSTDVASFGSISVSVSAYSAWGFRASEGPADTQSKLPSGQNERKPPWLSSVVLNNQGGQASDEREGPTEKRIVPTPSVVITGALRLPSHVCT